MIKITNFKSVCFYQAMFNLMKIFILLLGSKALAEVPVLQSYVGQPLIKIVEGSVVVKPEKNKKIEQSFTVKTAAKEQIKIRLGKDFDLIVFPESSLKIEGFYYTKKDYKIRAVIFDNGRFYIKNGSNIADDLTVIYQSDFFQWKNTEKINQREFFVEVNLATAEVRFCAGEKGLQASLFDHEVVKTLKFQEGASFQGVLKDGALDFDLLLEGRKIPKGSWQDNFTCDFPQILKEMNDLEALEKTKIQKEFKKQQALLKQKKLEYDKSLCHEPNGQFNECLWKKEKSYCVRYRCDGQGQWVDRQQLPRSQNFRCEQRPVVAKCDY